MLFNAQTNLFQKLEALSKHVVDSAVSRKIFLSLKSFFTVTKTQKVTLIDVLEFFLSKVQVLCSQLNGLNCF